MAAATSSQPYATKVELKEDGDHYLLYIPTALKERAKATLPDLSPGVE